MRPILLTGVLILTLLSPPVSAKSAVWKAEKNGQVLYLGGTVHMLTEKDFPLPEEFLTAYTASDTVVFEIDIDELNSPALQQKLTQIQRLPSGTIADRVNKETLEQLRQFFTERGLNFNHFSHSRPGFIAMTMNMLELREAGFNQQGVDQYFYTKAQQDGKTRQFLETAEQQLELIALLGTGYEDDFFHYTFEDLETLKQQITPMVNAWRTGDLAQMESLSLAEMKSEFPDVYQQLLVKRNHAWLEQLLKMAKTPEKEFVLGGVLHFPGEDGVINLLKQQGFTITTL